MRPGEPEPAARLEWGVAVASVLLILVFHFLFWLRAGALWRDEVNTLQMATWPSVREICDALPYDSFPLLSSLTLRPWALSRWGATDFGLRAFGFMVGTGILAALWLDARLKGVSVPLLSMSLFAASPLVIRFGDSIRPYGLGVLFLLVASGLIWRVSVRPGRLEIIAAALTAVLAVQCLYQNSLLLLAICAAGIVVCVRSRQWNRALQVWVIGAVSALSLAPYYDALRTAQDWGVVTQTSISWQGIWRVLAGALAAAGGLMTWFWLGLGAVSLIAAGWCVARRGSGPVSESRTDLVLFSGTMLVVATVTFLFFLKWARLLSQPWYYLPLMAVWAVSIDAILAALARSTAARIFRAAAAMVILALSIPDGWAEIQIRQTNVDRVASRLAESVKAGDLIVVSPWYYGVAFQRYYRGAAAWMTVPPIEDLRIHRYDLLKEKMKSADPTRTLLSRMSETLRSGNSLWLVGGFPAGVKRSSPELLRPAPDRRSGWNNYAYISNWAAQAKHLVHVRAREVEAIAISSVERVNPYENLVVQVARGWQCQ